MAILPPTIEGCHALIKEMYALILKLQHKIESLESVIVANSQNSHRPPSSDGLTKKPGMERPKGGKVGGQKGHTGKNLKMVTHPDHIENIFHRYVKLVVFR